jgi:hypothetical protein
MKKALSNIYGFFVAIFLLISMKLWQILAPKHKLKEEYIKWIPYEEGQILTFQNQNDEQLEIRIFGVIKEPIHDNDALNPYKQYNENITIMMVSPDIKINENPLKYMYPPKRGFINEILWSKSEGLIQFITEKSVWELKEKK